MTDLAGSNLAPSPTYEVSDSYQATTVLEQAPRTVAELPAYFKALDPVRLKRVWVSLIIEAIESRQSRDSGILELDPSMDPDWSIAQLAAALRAVRDHGGDPVPLPPPSKLGAKPARKQGSSAHRIEMALQLAKEGGEIHIRDLIGNGATCKVLRIDVEAGLHPGYRIEERPGSRGGRPMVFLVYTGEPEGA